MNYLFKKEKAIDKWTKSTNKSLSEFSKLVAKIKNESGVGAAESAALEIKLITKDEAIELINLLKSNDIAGTQFVKSLESIIQVSSYVLVKFEELCDYSQTIGTLISLVDTQKAKSSLKSLASIACIKECFSSFESYIRSIKLCLLNNNQDLLLSFLLPSKNTVGINNYFSCVTQKHDIKEESDAIFLLYLQLLLALELDKYDNKVIISAAIANSKRMEALYELLRVISKFSSKSPKPIMFSDIGCGIANLVCNINLERLLSDCKQNFENLIVAIDKCVIAAKAEPGRVEFDGFVFETQEFLNLPLLFLYKLLSDAPYFKYVTIYLDAWKQLFKSSDFSEAKENMKSMCLSIYFEKPDMPHNVELLKILLESSPYLKGLIEFLTAAKLDGEDHYLILKEIYILKSIVQKRESLTITEYLFHKLQKHLMIQLSPQQIERNSIDKEKEIKSEESLISQLLFIKSRVNIESIILNQVLTSKLNPFIFVMKNLEFLKKLELTDYFVKSFHEKLVAFNITKRISDLNLELIEKDIETLNTHLAQRALNSDSNQYQPFIDLCDELSKYLSFTKMLVFLEENKFSLDLISFDNYNSMNKLDSIKILLTKKYKFGSFSSVSSVLSRTEEFYQYFNIRLDEFVYLLLELFLASNQLKLIKECLCILSKNDNYFGYLEKSFLMYVRSQQDIPKLISELMSDEETHLVLQLLLEKSSNPVIIGYILNLDLTSAKNPCVKEQPSTKYKIKAKAHLGQGNVFYDNIYYSTYEAQEFQPKKGCLEESIYNVTSKYDEKKPEDEVAREEVLKNNPQNRLYTINSQLAQIFKNINFKYVGNEFKINTKIKYRMNIYKSLISKDNCTLSELLSIEGIQLPYLKEVSEETNLLLVRLTVFLMSLYEEKLEPKLENIMSQVSELIGMTSSKTILKETLINHFKFFNSITYSNLKALLKLNLVESLLKPSIKNIDNHLLLLKCIDEITDSRFNFLLFIDNSELSEHYNRWLKLGKELGLLSPFLFDNDFFNEVTANIKRFNRDFVIDFYTEVFGTINLVNIHNMQRIVSQIFGVNQESNSKLLNILFGMKACRIGLNYNKHVFLKLLPDLIGSFKSLSLLSDEVSREIITEEIYLLPSLSQILEGNLGLFMFEPKISDCIKNHFINKLCLLDKIEDRNQKRQERIKAIYISIQSLGEEDTRSKYLSLYDSEVTN